MFEDLNIAAELKVAGIFAVKIVFALTMGIIIGIERQLGQHPAGVRTNALVSFGACLFVSLSVFSSDGDVPRDVTRVAAQVVSGIGFICGGAIMREGVTVRGMNTAATMWCSAAIGSLVGLGHWQFALVGTMVLVGAHFVFRPLAHAIDSYAHKKGESDILYEVKLLIQRTAQEKIRAMMREELDGKKLRLQGITLSGATSMDELEVRVHLFAVHHNETAMNDLVSRLASDVDVLQVSWGKAH